MHVAAVRCEAETNIVKQCFTVKFLHHSGCLPINVSKTKFTLLCKAFKAV